MLEHLVPADSVVWGGCGVFRRKGPGGESGSLEYGGMRLEVYSLVLQPLDLFASWMLMGIGNLHTLSCTNVSHVHSTHSQLHRYEPCPLYILPAAQISATPIPHTLSCTDVSHCHSTTLSCTDVSYFYALSTRQTVLSQRSTCLFFLSAGIKGMLHHTWLWLLKCLRPEKDFI